MDTRFWGPSGWKLLHLITFHYNPKNNTYSQFFETIPYILPCHFCRASLTDYYKKYPFDPSDVKKWMYNIHNCVNNKLRKQGLNPNPNPKYNDVKKVYEEWTDWTNQMSVMWDFLFAIAYNHPKDSHSEPMPDCPVEVYKCKDNCEKNKWNVLSLQDKLYWFQRFWSFLPAVLPEEIAERWKEVPNKPTLHNRRSTLAWLWRMRCALDTNFKDPYTSICKKIANYSSDCGKNKRAITCRKKMRLKILLKTRLKSRGTIKTTK